MEQLNTNITFKVIKNDIKRIQIITFEKLENLFFLDKIIEFKLEIDKFNGVRGCYLDKENIVISYYFGYYDYNIEINLYYDQLEYYIFKEAKLIYKCNLEDYTQDEFEMSSTFVNYLKKDFKKLNILFKI